MWMSAGWEVSFEFWTRIAEIRISLKRYVYIDEKK